MSRLTIDTGTAGNPATGDSLRVAFGKVNANFADLYSGAITTETTNANLTLSANGTGQIVINSDRVVVNTSKTPTAIGVSGDVAGSISWDGTNLYVCTANYDGSTIIWKKLILQAI
jgi:hypothetical protein